MRCFVIKRWGLVYWEVGKDKVVSGCGLSEMSLDWWLIRLRDEITWLWHYIFKLPWHFFSKKRSKTSRKLRNKWARYQTKKNKQSPFRSIYNLGPVELKTLKIYIKINLANGFIYPSKSPARIVIFFDWKLDRNLCFCMDYWGLNNITIKN